MDQNIFQLITGMASVQKIGQESRSQTTFAKFDVLTPDEPGWAWQLPKHLLSHFLTRVVARKFPPIFAARIQQDIG